MLYARVGRKIWFKPIHSFCGRLCTDSRHIQGQWSENRIALGKRTQQKWFLYEPLTWIKATASPTAPKISDFRSRKSSSLLLQPTSFTWSLSVRMHFPSGVGPVQHPEGNVEFWKIGCQSSGPFIPQHVNCNIGNLMDWDRNKKKWILPILPHSAVASMQVCCLHNVLTFYWIHDPRRLPNLCASQNQQHQHRSQI